MTAARVTRGAISLSNSSHFALIPYSNVVKPVTLPPGRARLATRPVPTGSPAAAKTMGMTDVACMAAAIKLVPAVTMTSTLRWTNSAAISAARSVRPPPSDTRSR